MEELNQEEYCIMIQSDYSIKIGKLSKDLSRPKLKRTMAGIYYGTLSISEFSCLFQKLNNNNNNNNLLSSNNTHNNDNLLFEKEDSQTLQSLLPIMINNNEDKSNLDSSIK